MQEFHFTVTADSLDEAFDKIATNPSLFLDDDDDETSAEPSLDERDVEVVILNRKGLGQYSVTVKFTDMESLKKEVDRLVEAVDFYKVVVELSPNWTPTNEEQAEFDKIELGMITKPVQHELRK